MTRSELVEKLSLSHTHLTPHQTEKSVDIVLSEITSALAKGNRVELRGFGVFTTRKRESRQGRNPKTGHNVPVKEKFVPFFKAGKLLRERLNLA